MFGKTKQREDEKLNKSGYDYLLYFGSPSCSQCRALKESLKKANVVYEECDEYDKYNVMSFPTLILMEYKHGNNFEEADRRVGFQTVEQLDDFLRHSSVERRVHE
jgi:thioredoxin-related protein